MIFLLKIAIGILIGILLGSREIEKIINDYKNNKEK